MHADQGDNTAVLNMEKRLHDRYRCRMPIRFSLGNSVTTVGIGELLDIGRGGARLFAPGRFNPGDRIKLRFGSTPLRHITAECSIVWTGKAGMGTCGICFKSMPDSVWSQMHEVISS